MSKLNASNNSSLKLELVEKMTTLVTAGFGLVAGLAWNEAIQDLFAILFPKSGSLVAKFLYAIVVTVAIVVITTKLGRMSNALKEKINA